MGIRESRTSAWVRARLFNGLVSPFDGFGSIEMTWEYSLGEPLSNAECRELLRQLRDLDELDMISLKYSDIDDEDLTLLKARPNLRFLILLDTSMTSTALKNLAKISNLISLYPSR